jgi:hypothetical protein
MTTTADRLATVCWCLFWTALAAPFVIALGLGWAQGWPEALVSFTELPSTVSRFHHMTAPFYQLALLAFIGGFAIARCGGPSRRLYVIVRVMLFALSAAGIVVGLDRLARLGELVMADPLFAPPADDLAFRDTLLAGLAHAALTRDFDMALVEALEAGDVDRATAFVHAAELLHQPLRPATLQAYGEATSWPATLWRGTRDAVGGAVTGEIHSVASLGGALALDLTPLGDLRDLAIQLGFRERPDRWLVGLSVVGLGITSAALLAPTVAGPPAAAKSAMKAALRSSRTSAGLASDLRRVSSGSHLVARIAAGSGDLAEIHKVAGSRAALAVMREAESLSDLPLYRRIARTFGQKADGVITALGHGSKRVFRVYKASRPVVLALAGYLTLIGGSVAALLLSLSAPASSWLLRRVTLRLNR